MQPPGRSLVNELDMLWRNALALDRGHNKVDQYPDQMEHARQAIVEERDHGSTAKRCLMCGTKFECQMEFNYGKNIYTIQCESGCYKMTIYDLEKPLAAPTHRTIIIGDEDDD